MILIQIIFALAIITPIVCGFIYKNYWAAIISFVVMLFCIDSDNDGEVRVIMLLESGIISLVTITIVIRVILDFCGITNYIVKSWKGFCKRRQKEI